jgi:hypothetical protein
MEHIICFVTVLSIALTGEVFGQYTVQIRFSQVWRSSNQQEWRVDIFADVFDSDNNLVPESIASQYFYDWYKNNCQGEGYNPFLSGIGESGLDLAGHWYKQPHHPDCCNECHFSSYLIYVRVLIDGQWYNVA